MLSLSKASRAKLAATRRKSNAFIEPSPRGAVTKYAGRGPQARTLRLTSSVKTARVAVPTAKVMIKDQVRKSSNPSVGLAVKPC